MLVTVEDELGNAIDFECADGFASGWTSKAILEGRTYPSVPFVDDVRVVLDVGANCGATTVHLARLHPDATIHAFEPGAEARSLLERNAEPYPNVVVHPFGLTDADRDATLYVDPTDLGQSSVVPADEHAGDPEPVTLRSAAGWAEEHGIDRIDVLKVDVEGCEVQVLESLRSLLPTVKVLYLEYDDRSARRTLAAMLDPTHDLYLSTLMLMDQGECMYLRRDLADHPEATPRLREIVARLFAPR